MDNHELLQEKYDDALFALLMNERAESEGSRLIRENEALLQDSSYEIPEESERRFLRTIEHETSRSVHKHTNKKVLRFIGRLALGALIAVLLFGTAFALSPAFRAGTLNLLMQIDDKVASWMFQGDITSTNEAQFFPQIRVAWLPDGYIQKPDTITDSLHAVIDCTNDSGNLIRITVQVGDNALNTFDIENSDSRTEIVIQNSHGILIAKDSLIRITWLDEATNRVIMVSSESVDEDVLLRVANNVLLS